MYFCRKHVLVCTAVHCSQKGAQQVAARLRIELKRRGLDADVMVNTCDSIDLCDIGPNIVVYPEGIIYCAVQVKDIPDIIDSLRADGSPVERLRLTVDRVDEVRRRQLFATASTREPVPSDDFLALARAHGFDEAWCAEQARRGFIARKPHGEGQAVWVTSKARRRYGLPGGGAEG